MPTRSQTRTQQQERGVTDKPSASVASKDVPVSGQGFMRRQVTDAGEDASADGSSSQAVGRTSEQPAKWSTGDMVPPQGS
jgi:hypothetical protein